MILVDTSVWVDFLRGTDSPQRRVLHKLIEEEQDIGITELILTEVLQGIQRDRDFKRVQSLLLELPCYSPKGIETYLRAAHIYRECRKRGKGVRKTIDCLIAAICLEYNLILLHRDRDYDRIASCTGLRVLIP